MQSAGSVAQGQGKFEAQGQEVFGFSEVLASAGDLETVLIGTSRRSCVGWYPEPGKMLRITVRSATIPLNVEKSRRFGQTFHESE